MRQNSNIPKPKVTNHNQIPRNRDVVITRHDIVVNHKSSKDNSFIYD